MLCPNSLRALVDSVRSELVRYHAAAHNDGVRREDQRDGDNKIIAGSGAGWGKGALATRRRLATASVTNGLRSAVEGLTTALCGLDALTLIDAEEATQSPEGKA